MNQLFELLKKYVDIRLEILTVQAQEELVHFVAKLVKLTILSVLITLVLVFGSLSLAFALNTWLESSYWGFLIIALFFLILLGIFGSPKGQKILMQRIGNATIQIFLQNKPLSEDHEQNEKQSQP